jgi:hypothetical protein
MALAFADPLGPSPHKPHGGHLVALLARSPGPRCSPTCRVHVGGPARRPSKSAIVEKTGRSASGAKAALSHTRALASADGA